MESIFNQHTDIATGIKNHLQTLRREEQRLQVRLLAVDRCLRAIKELQVDAAGAEEGEDEYTEALANVEAVKYDLTTYLRQLRDRIVHIERGVAQIYSLEQTPSVQTFALYIEEDARLCARDVLVAREGYDELIENLQALSHLRDQ